MSRLSILLGILLVMNCLGLASAQRSDGFQFTSPLGVAAGYDNNFIAGSQVLNDTVILLTSPTLSWSRSTHKTNFDMSYEPEFEMYSHHSELNAWNHSATLHFSHRVDARLTFEAGDSFLSTTDPSRQLEDSLLFLPRGLFRQNLLYAGVSYRLDRRTTVHLRFDNAITTMELPRAVAGLFDQDSLAGTVSIDRTLNRHHFITGSYSYLYFVPFQTAARLNGPAFYQPLHNFDMGYTYSVNPGLIFRLSCGVIRGGQSAYTAAATVEKQLGQLWLTGGYQRYLSFFGPLSPIGGAPRGVIPFSQGLLPNSVYQVASFGVRGKLTKRLSVKATAMRARNAAGIRNGNIQSWVSRARLDYKLSGPFVVFTQLDFYNQNLNEFSPLPLSRRRYLGGVEIVLSHRREVIDVPNQSTVDGPADSDPPEPNAAEAGQRDN